MKRYIQKSHILRSKDKKQIALPLHLNNLTKSTKTVEQMEEIDNQQLFASSLHQTRLHILRYLYKNIF